MPPSVPMPTLQPGPNRGTRTALAATCLKTIIQRRTCVKNQVSCPVELVPPRPVLAYVVDRSHKVHALCGAADVHGNEEVVCCIAVRSAYSAAEHALVHHEPQRPVLYPQIVPASHTSHDSQPSSMQTETLISEDGHAFAEAVVGEVAVA